MDIQHLKLPDSLRKQLGKPMGELILGTPSENGQKLKNRFEEHSPHILVAIGDVVSEMLVTNSIFPHVLVTDGKTKRIELERKPQFEGYRTIRTASPAAEISIEAWQTIRDISKAIHQDSRIHLSVDGEEDLLALIFVHELPEGSVIVYGQPNEGAVILHVDQESKTRVEKTLMQMAIG